MLFGRRKQVVKRILIVEDEPLTAFDNENFLGDAGYEIVATVDDLDEAMRVLEEEEIHLILSDVRLRKQQTGIHLAKEAKKKGDGPAQPRSVQLGGADETEAEIGDATGRPEIKVQGVPGSSPRGARQSTFTPNTRVVSSRSAHQSGAPKFSLPACADSCRRCEANALIETSSDGCSITSAPTPKSPPEVCPILLSG